MYKKLQSIQTIANQFFNQGIDKISIKRDGHIIRFYANNKLIGKHKLTLAQLQEAYKWEGKSFAQSGL